MYRGRSQLTIPLGSSSKEEETRTTPIVFDWKDFEGKHHVRTPKIGSRGLEIEGSDEDLLDFFYFAASQTIGSSENAGRFSEMRRAGRGPAFVKLLTKEYKWIRDLAIEVWRDRLSYMQKHRTLTKCYLLLIFREELIG